MLLRQRAPLSVPKQLEGMKSRTFEFFGAVPKEVWWDNPRTVATLILLGRERQLQPRYAALASHYVFAPTLSACRHAATRSLDAEGDRQGRAEAVRPPVPCVADLEELNAFFRKRCEAGSRDRVVQSLLGPFTIQGPPRPKTWPRRALLPPHRFDPCVIRPAVAVDKFQTVAFLTTTDTASLADLPMRWVTVKGYASICVVIVAKGCTATHERSLEKHTMVLDPIHYLATLGKKPECAGSLALPGLEASRMLPWLSCRNWNESTVR